MLEEFDPFLPRGVKVKSSVSEFLRFVPVPTRGIWFEPVLKDRTVVVRLLRGLARLNEPRLRADRPDVLVANRSTVSTRLRARLTSRKRWV